ncbi:MAG: YbaB/EbfC family nucleoid-associated protein [Thermotogae bacterium]|nr:YbaB/EbfC family nucleoid-associated protein [Thermotogota bacterium]
MFGQFKQMKALWDLQQELKKFQKEIKNTRFEETGYNGNVKVVVGGDGKILEIHINPEALKDITSVENALVNAVNSAITKATEYQREKLKEFLAKLPPEYRKELEKLM